MMGTAEMQGWVAAFSKPISAHCQKTSAAYENQEASKGRGLVLTMRGLSKTASCERDIGLLSYIIFYIMIG